MSVRQKFLKETIDGRPYVSLHEWLSTLPAHEQEEFESARIRQEAYRTEAIQRGDMFIDPVDGSYVWKNNETSNRGKITDDVWSSYFERWMNECGIGNISIFENER